MDVLKDRLIEERQRSQYLIENDLNEAKLFYQISKELHEKESKFISVFIHSELEE